MNIVEEKENKLFARKDVTAKIENEAGGTVSRKQALQELKKQYPGGEIVIETIDQKFGTKNVLVKARVYSSTEKAKAFEPKWRLERGLPKQEGKGEAKESAPAQPTAKAAAPTPAEPAAEKA